MNKKYQNRHWKLFCHPRKIDIESKYRHVSCFSFVEVNEADIQKQILNLNGNKFCQNFDIPNKVIKENSDIFKIFLCTSFNSSIKTFKFLRYLKLANISSSTSLAHRTPLNKKVKIFNKKTIGPPVFCHICQKMYF